MDPVTSDADTPLTPTVAVEMSPPLLSFERLSFKPRLVGSLIFLIGTEEMVGATGAVSSDTEDVLPMAATPLTLTVAALTSATHITTLFLTLNPLPVDLLKVLTAVAGSGEMIGAVASKTNDELPMAPTTFTPQISPPAVETLPAPTE
eukprot:CAMPEP_0194349256 /NCGR_PEP_ID=MMETSP0171-20130528/106986_1 /TAXON_ID=218684 /ORGANISM="Corethron pennatum, Strain L29A3" /LENGTH=147 /DNA_ID=CAMNT_0039116681 /DNA_START=596 /DNA_END=1039 /DNA_ORIENTATION=-